MSDYFQQLIKRYAGAKRICNCGEAYYDAGGQCEYGCSANQISAKEYVAMKVLEELGELSVEVCAICGQEKESSNMRNCRGCGKTVCISCIIMGKCKSCLKQNIERRKHG